MAHTFSTRAGRPTGLDPAGAFGRIFTTARRKLRIAADRRLLDSMPDYLLHDLGIGRGDIANVTEHGRLGR
jgi:uncharacterized protein YjiS (DUF1127 family)